MRFWFGRIVLTAVGWRMAMSYPLDDSPASLFLSLGIGTLGVLIVGFVAYDIGLERGRAQHAEPADRGRGR